MRLSDHEINSALRDRLQMPTGRHLFAVLGTYGALERYERVSFSQALGSDGKPLKPPINVNRALLGRIPDDDLKELVQNEAKRPQSVRQRLAEEFDRLLVEELDAGPFVALKQVELVFAYDLELICLRTRGTNKKYILLLLPGQRTGDRITLFHEASPACHRTLPAGIVSDIHLWELVV
jgi:hypothetical protein